MIDWLEVEAELESGAKAIAWDTCHKIYVLMDDEQVKSMRGYGYDTLITVDKMTTDKMLEQIKDWYAQSCFLKFVESVSTVEGDPNGGFKTLIEQGADDDDDDDSDDEEEEE